MSESDTRLPERSVTFFVPCLNEEGNVGRAIDNIVGVMRELGTAFEILVVDDASTDGTVAEVLGRRGRYPDVTIRVLRNPVRRGIGGNYVVAAHHARGAHFMLVCGDAVEPPDSLRAIVSRMGQADAIVPFYAERDLRAKHRRFISGLFIEIVNFLSGHRLRYYNGPILHRTENVKMWFGQTSGFGYQADLMCRLMDRGISVEEVQVTNTERQHGTSKALRLRNLGDVAHTLWRIWLRRWHGIHPECAWTTFEVPQDAGVTPGELAAR